MATGGNLGDLLKHPMLVAAVMAAFAGYAGYINGQATQANELKELKSDVEELQAKQARRSWIIQCTTRTLDRLSDKTGVTPPCRLDGDQ